MTDARDLSDAAKTAIQEHISAVAFNADRAMAKCELGTDHSDPEHLGELVAYCGKCGWAPSLKWCANTIDALLQRLDAADRRIADQSVVLQIMREQVEVHDETDREGEVRAIAAEQALATLTQSHDALLAKVRALETIHGYNFLLERPASACWNCYGYGVHVDALGADDAIVWVPPYPCPVCDRTGVADPARAARPATPTE